MRAMWADIKFGKKRNRGYDHDHRVLAEVNGGGHLDLGQVVLNFTIWRLNG